MGPNCALRSASRHVGKLIWRAGQGHAMPTLGGSYGRNLQPTSVSENKDRRGPAVVPRIGPSTPHLPDWAVEARKWSGTRCRALVGHAVPPHCGHARLPLQGASLCFLMDDCFRIWLVNIRRLVVPVILLNSASKRFSPVVWVLGCGDVPHRNKPCKH